MPPCVNVAHLPSLLFSEDGVMVLDGQVFMSWSGPFYVYRLNEQFPDFLLLFLFPSLLIIQHLFFFLPAYLHIV